MKILVLGGTVFLSRNVAQYAVEHDHSVTTFSRGRSGEPVAGARHLIGDRDDPDSLRQVADQDYDLVFDTAYLPYQARQAADLLEPRAGQYAFTSTVNVFPGWPHQADYHAGGTYDGDPDVPGEQVPDGLPEGGEYGWRKVAAERAVLRRFGPDRTAILRAGLIVGRYDGVGRLPWWLHRVSRGGEVLAPGRAEQQLRMIDARDIAAFALTLAAGTWEVTGPAHQISRGQLMAELRAVTNSTAEFTWVDDGFLTDAGVQGWTELPLWIPEEAAPGVFAHDTAPAEAAGLACRPVRQTLQDVWDWMQAIPGGWQPSERTPGLAAEREQQLLAGWHAR
ncbi:MAG TPA: NAD-dependent epimerase/dehydratase family protein [Jatrophihabitans sp.]|nr:NAD-dependent epimerase/dehydratase family protein [Jatrophihabitans sp.]